MTDQPISNEVALRIALAARVLPDVSILDLIEALQASLDDGISEKSLSSLSVTQLKNAFSHLDKVDSEEEKDKGAANLEVTALKEAVRILWGEQQACEHSLLVEPYQPGDMPNSIRVAAASNTDEKLDGHFGSCHRYLIYQLSAKSLKLIDVRSALEADLSQDKNKFRIDLIRDCSVVYMVSVGGPAAAKIIQANIYPMKVGTGGEIRELLAALQQAIATSPPPWLAKLLGIAAGKRVKNYQAKQ
ncbi:MAG: dinitrogenase iron-molybdenum cofactor biosynthesis protein [Cyanobacteria bacterium J06614_10]